MEQIVIRLFKESDIDGINDLYNHAYQSNRTKEKFIWEYLSAPAGKAIYVVAEDTAAGKIVGTQCAIPMFMIDTVGKKILTAKSEDTLVASAYRGKNIFEKMYELLFAECKKAGIQFIWGFTYAIKPFQRIGFETPFKTDMGIRVIEPVESYNYLCSLNSKRSLVDKAKIWGLVLAGKIKSLFKSSGRVPDGFELDRSLPKDLNDFFQDTHLSMDHEFIRWRLARNPYPNDHVSYTMVRSDDKTIHGNILCSVHGGRVGYIMQMIFRPTVSYRDKESFLQYALSDFSGKVSLIRFWGFDFNKTSLDEIELLKRTGFLFIGRGITFVWKQLGDEQLKSTELLLSRMAAQGT